MNIRSRFTTSFAVLALAALPAAHAAVVTIHAPVLAMFGSGSGEKQIKFSVQNDTGAPLELKVGETVSTLKAGEVKRMKVPVGTRITTNTATSHHSVGDTIAVISGNMPSDSVLSIGK